VRLCVLSLPTPDGTATAPFRVTEDGEKWIPSHRIPEVNRTDPLVGRDAVESGWGQP
jgi:hypothetical protein